MRTRQIEADLKMGQIEADLKMRQVDVGFEYEID